MASPLGRALRSNRKIPRSGPALLPDDVLDLPGRAGADAIRAETTVEPNGDVVFNGVDIDDTYRRGAQEALANGNWRKIAGRLPGGSRAQAPVLGDVLKRRYYGDAYDKIVADADAAFMEDRPSHFSEHRTLLPSEAMQDRVLMMRTHDGSAASAPLGGVSSTVEDIEQLTANPGNFEDAHRGVENHELGHYADISYDPEILRGGVRENVFEGAEADRVRQALMERLDHPDAVERVFYAAKTPELLANIAEHKRNTFARTGKVPNTRDDVRAMFEGLAERSRLYDVQNPDLPEILEAEFGIDPSNPETGGHWDFYGPDPEAEFGPSKGRPLRGATETEMNLGHIFEEASPEEQSKMVEDYLRTVENRDIRKSLLARTA